MSTSARLRSNVVLTKFDSEQAKRLKDQYSWVHLDQSFRVLFNDPNVSITLLVLLVAISARSERGAHFWEPLFLLSTYDTDISQEELKGLWTPLVQRRNSDSSREIEADRCTLACLVMVESWIRAAETDLYPIDSPREGQAYYDIPHLWRRTEPTRITSEHKS